MSKNSKHDDSSHLLAAECYFNERKLYWDSLEVLRTLKEPVRTFLQEALLARVRRKFRGISNKLTASYGCHFSAACTEQNPPLPAERQREHAVPLRLVHNRILGIAQNGEKDEMTLNILPEMNDIYRFILKFVIGVSVSADQHKKLNKFKQSMPDRPHWDWLQSHEPKDWVQEFGDLQAAAHGAPPPAWLPALMARYEQHTSGRIDYHLVGHCESCSTLA